MLYRWLIIFGLLFFSIPAISNGEAPLEIEPVYPENQVAETRGYFDLLVEPGEEQTIELRVANNLEEEVILHGSTSNAYTHPTGGMLYSEEIDSENTRLLDHAVRLADFMEIKDTVTIPPQSSVPIHVNVSVPEEEGQTFLGGIVLTTEATSEEAGETNEEDTASFVLNTETSYTVAVQLNLSNKTPADFSLGEAGFINQTAEVYMEMTNNAQLIQEEITGTYSVTDESGAELFSGEIPSFKMAPASSIRYPMPWGHENLEDGTYTLTIKGTAGINTFSATETFTIESNDVQEYAERNMPQTSAMVNQGVPLWVWIAGVIVFGLVMFFIGGRRKQKAE